MANIKFNISSATQAKKTLSHYTVELTSTASTLTFKQLKLNRTGYNKTNIL